MQTLKIYRHGDVLLREVKKMPENAVKEDSRVLAEGEVTGHAHRIDEMGAIWGFDDKRYLEVQEGLAMLTHEEHKALEIGKGTYEIVIQREYDDENEWKRVTD